MANYHINPKTKKPGICRASTPASCRWKDDSKHFGSEAEAMDYLVEHDPGIRELIERNDRGFSKEEGAVQKMKLEARGSRAAEARARIRDKEVNRITESKEILSLSVRLFRSRQKLANQALRADSGYVDSGPIGEGSRIKDYSHNESVISSGPQVAAGKTTYAMLDLVADQLENDPPRFLRRIQQWSAKRKSVEKLNRRVEADRRALQNLLAEHGVTAEEARRVGYDI